MGPAAKTAQNNRENALTIITYIFNFQEHFLQILEHFCSHKKSNFEPEIKKTGEIQSLPTLSELVNRKFLLCEKNVKNLSWFSLVN